jgi:hypothetical protein
MARHGRASNIGGRGKNRVHNKGLSAYNDMVVEMEMSQTESELSGVMMAWYSICHGIDDFPSGEEPVPGTFDCRVCGMDLSSVHHAYEHTYACAAEAAAAKAQLLLDTLCPLGQPCHYQFCGEKDKFRQFDTCEKAFDSRAQLEEHMRSHMRTMRKRNDNSEWVPTCFFGDCALNPELGRNKRNGPDFASEEERLVHLWSKHRVNTLKALGHMFCEFCDTWLLEPQEWLAHATDLMADASVIIHKVGYCGIQAGRSIVPRLYPFCYHQNQAPGHVRIATWTREGHIKHIGDHLKKDQFTRQCPCYLERCSKSAEMNTAQLTKHPEVVHDINLPVRSIAARKPLADVSNARGSSRKKGDVKKTG